MTGHLLPVYYTGEPGQVALSVIHKKRLLGGGCIMINGQVVINLNSINMSYPKLCGLEACNPWIVPI